MRAETYYFAGVAGFFAVTSAVYGCFSGDPAGTAMLVVAFLMASLIAFFLLVQQRRHGMRPEDRPDGEVRQRAGPLGFFPPHSSWPVVTAAGFTVVALGFVHGLWLALIGAALLTAGILGFALQYATRTR